MPSDHGSSGSHAHRSTLASLEYCSSALDSSRRCSLRYAMAYYHPSLAYSNRLFYLSVLIWSEFWDELRTNELDCQRCRRPCWHSPQNQSSSMLLRSSLTEWQDIAVCNYPCRGGPCLLYPLKVRRLLQYRPLQLLCAMASFAYYLSNFCQNFHPNSFPKMWWAHIRSFCTFEVDCRGPWATQKFITRPLSYVKCTVALEASRRWTTPERAL